MWGQINIDNDRISKQYHLIKIKLRLCLHIMYGKFCTPTFIVWMYMHGDIFTTLYSANCPGVVNFISEPKICFL